MAQTQQQAYDSLASVYDPQIVGLQQQRNQLEGQQAAQQAGLDQAKVNAFKDITNASNNRGVLFSGIPIDQQATYVGTKYLPAVANLQTSFNNTRNQINTQIGTLAGRRQQEASQIVAAQQKAEAEDAYRQQQLALSYARLAKTGGGSKSTQLSQRDIISGISQGLSNVRGKKDGYVSPQDYAKALGVWVQQGLNRADFNKQFKNFRNPNNPYYDYAIRQAGY